MSSEQLGKARGVANLCHTCTRIHGHSWHLDPNSVVRRQALESAAAQRMHDFNPTRRLVRQHDRHGTDESCTQGWRLRLWLLRLAAIPLMTRISDHTGRGTLGCILTVGWSAPQLRGQFRNLARTTGGISEYRRVRCRLLTGTTLYDQHVVYMLCRTNVITSATSAVAGFYYRQSSVLIYTRRPFHSFHDGIKG